MDGIRSYKPGRRGTEEADTLTAANGCWHNPRLMNATAD